MNQSIVTGIVVTNNKRQILLVKKPDGVGPYAGTFLTPGGGVEIGESIDEAVVRELYEETGVRVKNLTRIHFMDAATENWKGVETHYIMLIYTGEYVSGNLKPTAGDDDDLEIIRWFYPSQLTSINLSPPLKEILQSLGYLQDY